MIKTVLVTGGTGYIGSWVVKYLLEKSYTVRLTVRDKAKQANYAHVHKLAETAPGKLEIWEADLLISGSFDAAANGADVIMHIASPFILKIKDAQKELINPALLGTRNVLEAANASPSVKKVVLTSSVAAVHGDNIDMKTMGLTEFTEEHFNNTSSLKHQPYSYSKTLAEKEAWDIYKLQSQWKLVVINPSFVMGPAINPETNSESIGFMKDILSGKLAMGAPDLCFGFVDVRDVAKAHLLAMEKGDAEGRHILAERTTGVFELTQIIKSIFGKKFKLPTKKSPKLLMYLVGWMFGLNAKFITRNVGHPIQLNNAKSIKKLGLVYTPLEKTIEDMVNQLDGSDDSTK